MAGELKVTRMEVQRDAGSGGTPHKCITYFVNTVADPPVPGNIAVNMSDTTLASDALMRTAVDNALALVTANTIDWDR